MSGENKDHYNHHNPCYTFTDELSAFFSQRVFGSNGLDNNQRPNDSQTMPPHGSFDDVDQQLHEPILDYSAMLERLFDVSSPPLKDMFDTGGSAVHRNELLVDTTTVNINGGNVNLAHTTGTTPTPVTPNPSVCSSSTEAGGEEDVGPSKKDQLKQEDGDEMEKKQPLKDNEERSNSESKDLNKQRKKGEKRQREPRVAFMTKSEVDHLEDGYRWRKYGQKAVKNTPHPRSYYRCTHQKCSVKKRVERSLQDPTIVITTYEGKHTHQIPTTVRRNAHLLSPPPMASAAVAPFTQQDLLMHQIGSSVNSNKFNYNNLQGNTTNPKAYLPTLPPDLLQFHFTDDGLLQDILPSLSFTKDRQT